MTFPVEHHVLGRTIPAHMLFEALAYAGGMQLFFILRRKNKSPLPFEKMMWLLVACIFGALFGSKLLAWAESPLDYWNARADPRVWLGGKTIVGGLLGGWIGVEFAKKFLHITTRTGDAFVFPLILGIAVGRIGCFLTGLPDHTYGIHSHLPWSVDFGDGPRHPTQLYEIAFLIMLGLWLALRGRSYPNGDLFRLFILAYSSFRFAIEFIKPTYKPWLGLSAIQVACALAAVICMQSLRV